MTKYSASVIFFLVYIISVVVSSYAKEGDFMAPLVPVLVMFMFISSFIVMLLMRLANNSCYIDFTIKCDFMLVDRAVFLSLIGVFCIILLIDPDWIVIYQIYTFFTLAYLSFVSLVLGD
jgi:hypothetical protein